MQDNFKNCYKYSKNRVFKNIVTIKIVAITIVICLIITSLMIAQNKKQENINNQSLLIVAHPDDETIFAGNEILNQPYFIICITNGDNAIRKKEFEAILKKTNNEGVILSYPDKVNGKRSQWRTCQEEIKQTILYYLQSKPWHKIVTHNPDGEYGHNQHILTSEIVTDAVVSLKKEDSLYYFAPYFKKNKIPSENKTMNHQVENNKKELTSYYPSQEKTIAKFHHIFGYEKFISYKDKDAIFRK